MFRALILRTDNDRHRLTTSKRLTRKVLEDPLGYPCTRMSNSLLYTASDKSFCIPNVKKAFVCLYGRPTCIYENPTGACRRSMDSNRGPTGEFPKGRLDGLSYTHSTMVPCVRNACKPHWVIYSTHCLLWKKCWFIPKTHRLMSTVKSHII